MLLDFIGVSLVPLDILVSGVPVSLEVDIVRVGSEHEKTKHGKLRLILEGINCGSDADERLAEQRSAELSKPYHGVNIKFKEAEKA